LAAAFLQAEDVDPDASLAIGSFAIFAGPAPPFDEFSRAIGGRLPLIPRYRQRLHRTALDLAPPTWVDDSDFDVARHVRHTTLPAPGGRAEIAALLSRVMARRMDRGRPLWEYWFVDGLLDRRWALLSKVHHCVVDGVSGTDLYRLLLDTTPTPGKAVPDLWVPRPAPSRWAAAARIAGDLVSTPFLAARRVLDAPVDVARATLAAAEGLVHLAGALRPLPATSLTGPLDGRRRYAWCEVGLDDVRLVRDATHATVNDVALAAVTGAFRRLLLARGEEPAPHALRSLVPVSTRASGDESTPDNQVSLMLPYLPVDISDPVERLATVRSRIRELRAGHEPEAGLGITTMAAYEPFPWVAQTVQLGLRLHQRQVATVTTNVPGPRMTLYALGRELQEILPYVPIADRVRIGVAIFSYRDTLTFGLTADHSVEDLDVLAEGIVASLGELVVAAQREGAGRPEATSRGQALRPRREDVGL
jgi:diacylglycerol O-acyltransferase